MRIQNIKIPDDASRAVRNGHPWVYSGPKIKNLPEPGTPIRLIDSKEKAIGFGLSDEGPIAIRVLGKNPDTIPNIIERKIKHAAELRARLFDETQTNCYRLVNGPGDNLPGLVVDRYGSVAIVRLYGKCWEPYLKHICISLHTLPGIESTFRRFGVKRVDGKKGGQLLSGKSVPDDFVVLENGFKFLVRPRVGQKTGLFLDQREHRAHIGRLSKGQVVANLFSYTGGFSVYAAAGGAKRVFSVDISDAAINDAKENFRLNGIDINNHVFEATDAFKWTASEPLSLLICDPPSLSHGQQADQTAHKAYESLATQCAKQLKRGDLLATASCTARLKQSKWEEAIEWGLKRQGRWSWLWRAAEPPDHPISTFHPEGRYLKFSILVKMR
jgi:23S rRNA (cytosine1962-C5)-methyltransferase